MARIALVDSDQNCRLICAAVLRHFGHSVECYDHLAEAAASRATGFDLFIVDPGWNYRGQESYLDFLRELVPDPPVILVSGGVTGGANESELRRGVRLLPKPFPIEILRDAIEQLVTHAPSSASR
ncbi:MAG: hypothetical protein C0518_03150 [Opitutus sp.]|nr:hypothetical protein [Opitutus sp.]